MSAQAEETFEAPAGKYLVDTYEDWERGEGVPVHSGDALDLATLATRPWARFGLNGAICRLNGHCDFLGLFLMEPASGQWSAPQRHLYEEVCFVISGEGETEIDLGAGGKRVVAWKPGSLFSAPMNASYRHRSASGGLARVVCVNDLRYLMNLYRNEKFLFENPAAFAERGAGDLVTDLAAVPVGAGTWAHERVAPLALAEGSIGADVLELAEGTYGQARRQIYGSLLIGLAGQGMTLSRSDPEEPRARVDWKHGIAFAPAALAFHQHFNVGAAPARLLRVEFGTINYPILRPRRRAYGDTNVYASGNAEVAYADEAPELRRDWLATLKSRGVPNRM